METNLLPAHEPGMSTIHHVRTGQTIAALTQMFAPLLDPAQHVG